MPQWWPFRVRGYEKFWNALLAGNSVQVPVIITLASIGRLVQDAAPYLPTPEAVIATVGIFWTALFSALGAFIALNTEPVANSTTEPNQEPQP